MSARPVQLRTAFVLGLCAAVLAYSSGVSASWSALAGLLAAGLAYAVFALL